MSIVYDSDASKTEKLGETKPWELIKRHFTDKISKFLHGQKKAQIKGKVSKY